MCGGVRFWNLHFNSLTEQNSYQDLQLICGKIQRSVKSTSFIIIVNIDYMKCVQYIITNTDLMNASCKDLHETNLGERFNKTHVSGMLILLDSEFTIMTKYMKFSRVWNFNS